MSTEDDFSAFRRVAGEEMAKLREENAKLRAHAERVGEANDRLAVENGALRELVGTLGAPNHINVPSEQWRELRADKERLDWLETQDCWIGVYGDYEISSRISAGGGYSQTIRAAVDAARKEAQP